MSLTFGGLKREKLSDLENYEVGLWKDKRNRKKEGKEVEEQGTVKKKVGGKNKRGWGWGCIYEKSEGDIGVKGCVRGD